MSARKKILILIDWYLPAYKAGGPIKSIYSLCASLKDSCDFYILCSDRDLGSQNAFKGIDTEKWTKREEAMVMYMPQAKLNRRFYRRFFLESQFDSVYLNSLFSFRFSLLPIRELRKQKIRVVLAPRGMLGAGALSIKPIKKKVFLAIARLSKMFSHVHWHSTSPGESSEIREHIGRQAHILQARNFSRVFLPHGYSHSKDKSKGDLRLFFLSRISKKKNLEGALRILSALDDSLPIELNIIGPVEEKDYYYKCKEIMNGLPKNIKVVEHGPIKNENLHEILRNMHFLILPTLHENYGHVIVESWAMGCPVIISSNTPWKKLQEKHLGWELELEDNEAWKQVIKLALEMDSNQFESWSEASSKFGQEIQYDEELKKSYLKLLT